MLKTKDDKKYQEANIWYSIEFQGLYPLIIEKKLEKAKLLWLNMNSDISFVETLKEISNLKFWLKDPDPKETSGSTNQAACVNEVTT